MEIPSNSNERKHTHLYPVCLINMCLVLNPRPFRLFVRPSSQGHYNKVSTPLTFARRFYKCYGKQPKLHASIIFLPGYWSSSPGPLAL